MDVGSAKGKERERKEKPERPKQSLSAELMTERSALFQGSQQDEGQEKHPSRAAGCPFSATAMGNETKILSST